MSKSLVCHLIKTQTGEGYCSIVGALFDHEELQLGELVKYARVEPEELRQMLILLLKNDYVEYLEKIDGQTKTVIYKLNLENVLGIGLYPKYLSFFEERFSVLSKNIAESLIINGRMNVKACIENTKENIGLELQGHESDMYSLSQQQRSRLHNGVRQPGDPRLHYAGAQGGPSAVVELAAGATGGQYPPLTSPSGEAQARADGFGEEELEPSEEEAEELRELPAGGLAHQPQDI